MAAVEGWMSASVASVVEDVLRQQGKRLDDLDLASRRAEETASRRNEAAGWLRKTVGVVAAKDLPEEPSEEEFRLGLRNGMILCNVLNKVVPGAVPKVVEIPSDTVATPDGAAISAYQYFENIRNFLVVVQQMGIPMFQASDLEQGGERSRVVNCILALKSFHEWKKMGGIGSWKYSGGPVKSISSGKHFLRKNSEPFVKPSLSRTSSVNGDSFQEALSEEQKENGEFPMESSKMTLQMLVHAVLSDRKPEEVPSLVESLLSRVMEEYEHRIASQKDLVTEETKETNHDNSKKVIIQSSSSDVTNLKDGILKKSTILDQQHIYIQELKHALSITKDGMDHMKIQYTEDINKIGKHIQVLAHAALGYHKMLEENRKLYNQVQDLKGNIRVYCRVRPFLPGQSSSATSVGRIDDGTITIFTPIKYVKDGQKSFTFNKVFGPYATQEEVFTDMQPLIRSVLDGYNVCIFAYGQTGSGKTHTMIGPKDLNEENQGVNYRALNDLFYISEQRKDTFQYEISVQMLEIYNEQVRDLLANDGLNKRLEIRNSSQNGLNVPDASLVPVASTSEVIELMNIGQRNRAVSATALNDRSSRSHSCLTIHVWGRDLASRTFLRGCMHLVDLAGSERVDKSEVKGDRLKEALHINKSLSALGDVIASLAQKNSHVPYRNSKLTQLLQDSLGGQAKTLMFVHISPEVDAVGETISTLKFAERVGTVELGAARLNKESNEVKELKEQVGSLKAALAKREGEHDFFRSTMSSPDIFRTQASTSPGSNWHNESDILSCLINHRQQFEQVRNIEVSETSTLRKSPSFDLHDLLVTTESSPWQETNLGPNNFQKGEANKHSSLISDDDENHLREWEGGDGCSVGRDTADFLYEGFLPDAGIYHDQHYNNNNSQRKENRERRFDSTVTDDSDLDVASVSSESDLLWQFNIPKAAAAAGTPNGGTSKIKRPIEAKSFKIPDTKRSASRSRIPSPSGKTSSGSSQAVAAASTRIGRLLSLDARRSSSAGKPRSAGR